MDKKTIIAIALCIGVYFLWEAFFMPKAPPPGQPVTQSANGGPVAGSPAVAGQDGGSNPGQTPTAATGDGAENPAAEGSEAETKPVAPRPDEVLAKMKTEDFEATFTSKGASLKSFLLTKYRAQGSEQGTAERENLVSTKTEQDAPFRIRFNDDKSSFKMPKDSDWEIVSQDENTVVFRFLDPENGNLPIITKTYKRTSTAYVLDLDIEVSNPGNESMQEQMVLQTFAQIAPAPETNGCGGGRPPAPRAPVCFFRDELMSLTTSGGCCGQSALILGGSKTAEPNVFWAGINEQYFLTAAIPRNEGDSACVVEADRDGKMTASMMYPASTLAPGGSVRHNYRLYLGPKHQDLLGVVANGETPEKGRSARLQESVDFGIFSILCHPMMWLLKMFHSIFSNWGVAIILLTVVMKLLLWPLNQKSMKSMRQMARLKPLMEEIKKKYGADKQRMNQETMAMYKQHKINPMGGCFPMLLQMPIWFALYAMLYAAVELYQTPFIPGWIDDLSFRDPSFVMPIVLGATMFLQQKLSPTTADSQQAKMMLYFMPAFFTFIMLYLPAGLVLYIFTNSLLSIGQQFLYNRANPIK